ncbi:unnamed protein product [Blepharisma stoltei]|uniref:Uncharacterized protein n=1 Tax=Blepharisma stoltei TaxID=1481888 RepID=A0AAU9ICJ3_9CILI|nr:unnamed protein product [Blepharisma stoltei]
MEKDLYNRIVKLKQDLASAVVSKLPRKSDEFAAYLSQSFKKPSSPPQELYTFRGQDQGHYKSILEERQRRITELEDETQYLRQTLKEKEDEFSQKIEKIIEAAQINCDSLASYYEIQIVQAKKDSKKQEQIQLEADLANALQTIQKLEEENCALRNDAKAKDEEIKQISVDKSAAEKELSAVKEQLDSTTNMLSYVKETERSMEREAEIDLEKYKKEVENLREIKDKLELEIANIEREKSQSINEAVEEYEEKYINASKSAEFWKTRASHLSIKFFTFLRSLKMDIFEIKHEAVQYFEDSVTIASAAITSAVKKYKFTVEDLQEYIEEINLKAKLKKKRSKMFLH